jgi:hypothetical protein
MLPENKVKKLCRCHIIGYGKAFVLFTAKQGYENIESSLDIIDRHDDHT